MQLTQFSDYAIRLLIVLAGENGKAITIGTAAQKLGVSKNHLVKVAHLLVQKGFILGTRGRTGGIQLKKSADDIRLGEILRLTEPTMIPVECMQRSGACTLEKVCRCPSYLHRGMQAFLHELDQATLASVVSPYRVN